MGQPSPGFSTTVHVILAAGVPALRRLVNRLDPLLLGSRFESWLKEFWPGRHDLIAIDAKIADSEGSVGAAKSRNRELWDRLGRTTGPSDFSPYPSLHFTSFLQSIICIEKQLFFVQPLTY
jgi:hypothetical protein